MSHISEIASKELSELSQWLKVNKLSLNLKKTQYMIFSRRKSKDETINIKIDNQSISETKSSKFLGVYIDNNLNWKTHINYIAGKISRGIGKQEISQRGQFNDFIIVSYIPS